MPTMLPDSLPDPSRTILKIRVARSVEGAIRRGHPWVFDRAIDPMPAAGPPGSLATIYDHANRFLAVGLYDPTSPIRIRVLAALRPVTIDAEWFAGRFDAAAGIREGLVGQGTTGFRLIHAENDGLPGLVLDRYGSVLVMKLYTCAWIPHLKQILTALAAPAPAEMDVAASSWPRPIDALVLRLGRSLKDRAVHLHGLTDGAVLAGATPRGPVLFTENGLTFEADVLRGQKTGFFLDQRDNRARVRRLSEGLRVLNVCSFSGGFSVYAAAGGARHVTSLDVSPHALESARRNFAHNPRLARVPHETVLGDAFALLARRIQEGARDDLVVLDPPAFAMRRTERGAALAAYHRLNALGGKVCARQGLLLTCSCTAHVTAEEFEAAVRRGLGPRRHRILERIGQPVDHPIGFREGAYLKALLIRMDG